MRIGLLNAFPWLEFSAEREFIRRCILVLRRAGHEAEELRDSDEVAAFAPDVVVSTHQFAPKLTDHFTVGTGWNPLSGILGDERQYAWLRSWDMTLPINGEVRAFLERVHADRPATDAITEMEFFPSAPATDLPQAALETPELVYVGTLWDRKRHGGLFEKLAERCAFRAYGPQAAWSFLKKGYAGPIPFDGASVLATLNRHGVVLALHKATHRDGDTPSMRVFEACAAGCFVITDPMPTLVARFGDTIDYVDTRGREKATLAAIVAAVERVRADPATARRRAAAARAIFEETASLDVLMARFVAEIEAALELRRERAARLALPVTVILRIGVGADEAAAASLASLGAAQGARIELRPIGPGLDAALAEQIAARAGEGAIKAVVLGGAATAPEALRAVRAASGDDRWVTVLDAGDTVFADHFVDVAAVVERRDGAVDCVQTGSVLEWSDPRVAPAHPHLTSGDGRLWPERRRLGLCAAIDAVDLFDPEVPVAPGCFVFRAGLVEAGPRAEVPLAALSDVRMLLDVVLRARLRAFTGRASIVVATDGRTDRLGRTRPEAEAEVDRLVRSLDPDLRDGDRSASDLAAAWRDRLRRRAATPSRRPRGLSRLLRRWAASIAKRLG